LASSYSGRSPEQSEEMKLLATALNKLSPDERKLLHEMLERSIQAARDEVLTLRPENARLRELLREVIDVANDWCVSASGGEVIDRAEDYLRTHGQQT
jgi:hypothetical protein